VRMNQNERDQQRQHAGIWTDQAPDQPGSLGSRR
jgi:hypothetical protein